MQFISDSANLYRIETTRKSVILTMRTGEELKGNVFIHLSSYRPFELEDVSELFNADSPFFPLELDNREVILVAKERVAEVAANRGDAASDQEPGEGPIPTLESLLTLVGGRVPLLLEVKVEKDVWRWIPALEQALSDVDAWITGIRREQAPTRANAQHVERDEKRGIWKFNPLVEWTDKDVWSYISKHDLPYNPLHDRGYDSIGCTPCTLPGAGREGRWAGTDKVECGIHVS